MFDNLYSNYLRDPFFCLWIKRGLFTREGKKKNLIDKFFFFFHNCNIKRGIWGHFLILDLVFWRIDVRRKKIKIEKNKKKCKTITIFTPL